MPQTKNRPRNVNDFVWEVKVPNEVAVYEDPTSRAKSVAFPINFPDGYPGIIIVTKQLRSGWVPSSDIDTIVINFKL